MKPPFSSSAGGTLYMSPHYTTKDRPVLAYFAFLAYGAGLIKREFLHLPGPDSSHWSEDVINEVAEDIGRRRRRWAGFDSR